MAEQDSYEYENDFVEEEVNNYEDLPSDQVYSQISTDSKPKFHKNQEEDDYQYY